MIKRIFSLATLAVAGCMGVPAPNAPLTLNGSPVESAAVELRSLTDTSTTPPAVPASPSGPTTQLRIAVPPNTLYVCVVDVGGVRKQTAILFAPKVEELCTRHPEMGPCQYERNTCRRAGGRIYAANGTEITVATEAEYDKKVLRVRFKGG